MATIRFNSTVFTYIVRTGSPYGSPLFTDYYNVNSPAATTALCGGGLFGNTVINSLLIYKGSIGSFPSFTNVSSRSSDLLLTMPMTMTASYLEESSSNSKRFLTGITASPGGTASATGTGSWFLLYNTWASDLTTGSALVGTVGTVGSGADLEIASTSIVSGNLYKCNGFYLNFPYDMTI